MARPPVLIIAGLAAATNSGIESTPAPISRAAKAALAIHDRFPQVMVMETGVQPDPGTSYVWDQLRNKLGVRWCTYRIDGFSQSSSEPEPSSEQLPEIHDMESLLLESRSRMVFVCGVGELAKRVAVELQARYFTVVFVLDASVLSEGVNADNMQACKELSAAGIRLTYSQVVPNSREDG